MARKDGRALILAPVLLAMMAACGSEGGGGPSPVDDTLRPIADEELSRMVLSIAQLRPEYGAFVSAEENGVLTRDGAAEFFHDPEGLQLVEHGWEAGYQASYQVPEGDEKPTGLAYVLSMVHIYESSDGAAASLTAPDPTGGSGTTLRTLNPSDAARFHRFEVDLADEADGFRLRDEKVFGPEDDSTLSSAFVSFRRGRLIGKLAVVAHNLSDQEEQELEDTAKDLAGKMNDQMSAVLAATPVASGS